MTKLIIDIGSNSIKYMVVQDQDILNKGKTDIGLYNMVVSSYKSPDSIMSHLMLDIEDILSSNQKFNPTETLIYATGAMRQFEARDLFKEKLEEKVGLNLRILTPEEEANFIFEVVSKNYPDQENLIVIDMGGASTEISLGLKGRYIDGISLPIGTGNTNKIGLMKLEAEKSLTKILDVISSLYTRPMAVLTGGTVDCLYRLNAITSEGEYDQFIIPDFKDYFNANKDNLQEYRQITTTNAIVVLDYILGDLLDLASYAPRKIYVCKEDLRFYFI